LNASDSESPLRGTTLRAIVGPTAVGKSALALEVAERSGAEIVVLDSMQVYRGMDVGTAKPTAAERARVRHHMLDLVEPSERYDVQRYVRDLATVLDGIRARGAHALFVGGTGFYLKVLTSGLFDGPDVDLELRARLMKRAAVEGDLALHAELAGIDPVSAARIHPNDTKRVVRGLEVYLQTGTLPSSLRTQWDSPSARGERHIVGLTARSDALDARIRARAVSMLAAGWPAEAARVRDTTGFGATAVQALGYHEALLVFDGRLGVAEAADAIARATRQFARRQRTWYRKFDDIVWFDVDEKHAERGELVPAALRALQL
jgi:tRNA dimethylallyltransferase